MKQSEVERAYKMGYREGFLSAINKSAFERGYLRAGPTGSALALACKRYMNEVISEPDPPKEKKV